MRKAINVFAHGNEDWKAAAWWLARRERSIWGPPKEQAPTPGAGITVVVRRFSAQGGEDIAVSP